MLCPRVYLRRESIDNMLLDLHTWTNLIYMSLLPVMAEFSCLSGARAVDYLGWWQSAVHSLMLGKPGLIHVAAAVSGGQSILQEALQADL